MKEFIKQNYGDMLELLRALCHIPAPSHKEQERAIYCKQWLEANGARGVYIDEAQNVIFPINCKESNDITVLAAHIDTVFPDTEPMPFKEDDEKIYCPGVGDDTASVAVLLMVAKFYIQNQIVPPRGLLIVCNSCEEGLGNLLGTKKIMTTYGRRIKQFVTLDSNLQIMNDYCVGSHRYHVQIATEGGHSFQEFGKPNAIAVLSQIVSDIYKIQVPKSDKYRTTYNVGIIEGGTSVNTIAQSAEMLCEYRSDNAEALEIMRNEFESIFSSIKSDDITIHVRRIGDRPCAGELDVIKQNALVECCKKIVEEVINRTVICKSASTDCNIPLSMGIPAVCIGVYEGGGSHTREEWINKVSLRSGLEIAIRIAERITDVL